MKTTSSGDGLRAGLGSLIAIANNEDTYEQLRTFGRWLIMPLSKRLGWEPAASEELFTTLLRLDTLMLAGSLGVEAVVAEARRRFQQGAIPAEPSNWHLLHNWTQWGCN